MQQPEVTGLSAPAACMEGEYAMNQENKKHRKKSRVILTVTCAVLAVILVVLVAATVYVEVTLGRIRRPEQQQTLSPEEMSSILEETDPHDPDFFGPTYNEGDVTAPVETDSGVYVAQLTSLLDREATDAEKENIVEQRRQDQYDSLLEDWREDADIDVNERVWDKVDFIDQGITLISSEDEESSASDDTAETEQNEDASSEDGSGAESGTEENAE